MTDFCSSPTGWFAEFHLRGAEVVRRPVQAWIDGTAMVVDLDKNGLSVATGMPGFRGLVDDTDEQITHYVPANPGWSATYTAGADGRYSAVIAAWAITAGGRGFPMISEGAELRVLHGDDYPDLAVQVGRQPPLKRADEPS